VPIGRQIQQVRSADVVVATPGRLSDLIERHACTLARIEITVLDEADHMADLGFLPVVTRLLDQTPSDGQRMFFSATLDRGVGQLVTKYVTDPALHAVPVTTESTPAEHSVLVLRAEDKVPVAAEIASRPGRTLFFVRTKHGADRLVQQLSRAGVGAEAIHGNRNQNQRQRALEAFAAGHPRVLVATDVAARGIHVDDVDVVVHYDPPEEQKSYVHRSGRTARAGNEGMVGISLFMGGETTPSRAVVQSAGHGYRLRGELLKKEFDAGGALQQLVLRYTQALITQMAQTAVCNRHHAVEQQLCRWLLLSLDRLPTNELTMTQELIANMLGVRREGVTEAAGKLQAAGMIEYSRGKITVLDRPKLENRVCECYAVVKQESDRLLPRAEQLS